MNSYELNVICTFWSDLPLRDIRVRGGSICVMKVMLSDTKNHEHKSKDYKFYYCHKLP